MNNNVTTDQDLLVVADWKDPLLKWETWAYSNDKPQVSTTTTRPPRLLIAQYDAGRIHPPGTTGYSYHVMLETTRRVNRAYAERFSHDYVLLHGLYLQTQREKQQEERQQLETKNDSDGTNVVVVPDARSTYNKIAILERHLEEGVYDRLLLLDSDAMIVDWDVDVATALSREIDERRTAVAGLQVLADFMDLKFSWNINVGVTLWNLRHADAAHIVRLWKLRSAARVRRGLRDDDQTPLQFVLWRMPTWKRPVAALQSAEFGYQQGTLIRHYIRPSSKSWTETSYNSTARIDAIQRAARGICRAYHTPAACPPNR